MKKPIHSKQAVARGIQILEMAIASKEMDLGKLQDESNEFKMYIKLHEMYEKNPDSMQKPMYNKSALRDGVQRIRDNIRRVQEAIREDKQKRDQFYQILAAHKVYEEWAESHPQEASGVIEIRAQLDDDPCYTGGE